MVPRVQLPPEIQLAQRLAGNDQVTRDRAVRKLRKYIVARTQRAAGGQGEGERGAGSGPRDADCLGPPRGRGAGPMGRCPPRPAPSRPLCLQGSDTWFRCVPTSDSGPSLPAPIRPRRLLPLASRTRNRTVCYWIDFRLYCHMEAPSPKAENVILASCAYGSQWPLVSSRRITGAFFTTADSTSAQPDRRGHLGFSKLCRSLGYPSCILRRTNAPLWRWEPDSTWCTLASALCYPERLRSLSPNI